MAEVHVHYIHPKIGKICNIWDSQLNYSQKQLPNSISSDVPLDKQLSVSFPAQNGKI